MRRRIKVSRGSRSPRSPTRLDKRLQRLSGAFHQKHLGGTCGRDIFGKGTIGNPLQLFERAGKIGGYVYSI